MRAALPVACAMLALVGQALAATLEPTPAQTEGPYYPRAKPADSDADLTRVGSAPAAKGAPLRLTGRVLATTGGAVAGARVEIWQVDHQGIYLHPDDPRVRRRDSGFQGYGEVRTGADGGFSFLTIMPPAYEGRPRHIHVKVTPPRGATLTTQLYFKDDPLLARDGIARRTGKALEQLLLAPAPASGGEAAAAITLVVKAPPAGQ